MRKLVSLLMVVAAIGAAAAQEGSTAAHVATNPTDIKWGEGPPAFEKGMSFAVLSGDPGKEGPFVVRLKVPAGYTIAPHWHPTDENVTVIAGTFALGMGDKVDKAAAKQLPAGGYALLPAQMHHYAVAITEATVQVHGKGPFTLTYVNASDDPRKRAPGK